jgi:DNA polymerase III alpha subunit (gram-positive type)
MFFVDIETTGLDYFRNEILVMSISFCDYSLNEVDSVLIKFKPQNLSSWSMEAQSVHKITKEQAMAFQDAKISWKMFFDFISCYGNNSPLVCHAKWFNLYFDSAFINAQCFLMDKLYQKRKFVSDKTLSTHTIAKHLRRVSSVASTEKLSLDALCKVHNIKLDHHNAESDRQACQALFKIFFPHLKKDIMQSNDEIIESDHLRLSDYFYYHKLEAYNA